VVADELAEGFELFDSWEERYHYLHELGEKLPPMPEALKTDATRVHGCQSVVHLYARRRPGADGVIEFLADSNTDLVRGLIGVLQQLFSGQRAEEVLAFNVEGFFSRVGLDQHLVVGRRNGLAAMVQKIRAFAAGLAAHQPAAVTE
jgi:cysteine desulfurase/selenocysteine lyase